MKLQLRCSEKGLKSQSLKRIAEELTSRLGYKVWRTTKTNLGVNVQQLRWGAPADKLSQYKFFKHNGLSALEFTTDQAVAGSWFNAGEVVFGRKLLSSYEGKGIIVFDPKKALESELFKKEILECKVFTKYIPKKQEFRVHVFKGMVVSILEKRKKKGFEGESDPKIRNTKNGYIFCQYGPNGGPLEISEDVRKRIELLALDARKVCGSDFVGVDIGYNQKKDNIFIIEVNSAPGIEGSNVQKYCDAIQKHYGL